MIATSHIAVDTFQTEASVAHITAIESYTEIVVTHTCTLLRKRKALLNMRFNMILFSTPSFLLR